MREFHLANACSRLLLLSWGLSDSELKVAIGQLGIPEFRMAYLLDNT